MSVIIKTLRINAINELFKKSLITTCSLCSKSGLPRKCPRKRELSQKFTETSSLSENDTPAISCLPDSAELQNDKLLGGIVNNVDDKKDKLVKEKVKELSLALNISQEKTAILFQKYKFLTLSKMATINSKINYLLENGISKEELLNDLWILTYTIPTLEKRIKVLKELNMQPIKPWLLRCSDQMLHRLSMNRENNRLAMGSSKTVTDYLKERLGLSDSQIWYFASRYPPVMRVKVAKLKEMIDFLYAEGFSSNQIYQTPRILCHSVITIQERLKELKAINYEPYSLGLLCKSQRHFRKIIMSQEKENRS